jgi:hypothetical protein
MGAFSGRVIVGYVGLWCTGNYTCRIEIWIPDRVDEKCPDSRQTGTRMARTSIADLQTYAYPYSNYSIYAAGMSAMIIDLHACIHTN